jgi:hypothetical protein
MVVFDTVVMPNVRNVCLLDSGSRMAGNRIENVVVLLSGTLAMITLTSVPTFTLDDEIWFPAKSSVLRPFLNVKRGLPSMLVVE